MKGLVCILEHIDEITKEFIVGFDTEYDKIRYLQKYVRRGS